MQLSVATLKWKWGYMICQVTVEKCIILVLSRHFYSTNIFLYRLNNVYSVVEWYIFQDACRWHHSGIVLTSYWLYAFFVIFVWEVPQFNIWRNIHPPSSTMEWAAKINLIFVSSWNKDKDEELVVANQVFHQHMFSP